MIQAGKLGMAQEARPTRLTPNGQITQMTLWCLLAAPLLLSCDLSRLDDFTLALLTNDEVLDVNQDSLGKQGWRRAQEGRTQVWAKPLWDGALAVGLFNLGAYKRDITAKWPDLGLSGKQPVRDLWQKKDLGPFEDAFRASVPGHGAVMLKIGTPNPIRE
jgi:alpha-galactosidase